jgi:hypothetical protein
MDDPRVSAASLRHPIAAALRPENGKPEAIFGHQFPKPPVISGSASFTA